MTKIWFKKNQNKAVFRKRYHKRWYHVGWSRMRTKGIIKKINHLIIKQNQRIQSEKRKKEILFFWSPYCSQYWRRNAYKWFWKWNTSVKKNQVKEKKSKYQAPKQMFQKLPTALAHVKSGNTSKDLLNEIV